MNGGILPLLLICATLGLALAFAAPRAAWLGFAGMAAAGVALSLAPFPNSASGIIFTGLWLSVIATAALTFVPRRIANRLIIPAGINAGAWAGSLAGLSDKPGGLFLALTLGLLFIPARWFTMHGHHIVVKVVASWMIAIASLSMFVSFMPTPGYKPDHME